ncbi:uncharacterized protein J3D65DRAFT_345278 [Phyllosticta citribraziliensis]|uniref:polynucleotide adenylyltransferase n=1 Tax=Phyllosticta citribraziliensis TaxID=989973 RepID=A0ABR1LUA9_9PEZI
MSSYRPAYNGQRDSRNHRDGGGGRSRRPSPARRDPPPMYQFGGGGGGGGAGRDSYRPGQSYDDRNGNRPGRDRPNDFTFRAGNDHDMRFPASDTSRFAGAAHRRMPPRDSRRPRQHHQPGRIWRPPPAPHERPILQSTREKTPEQFAGMNDGPTKFIALSDVSDSEAEMELESQSGDEQDPLHRGDGQPAAKKARVASEDKSDADAVPRWSNPDPYTSLPPPDESQTKKRDFVKLIRKAKVASDRAEASNAVTQNADFISLTFDDEEEQKSEDEDNASSDEQGRAGSSSANAPRFSHLDNLHPNRSINGAPDNMASYQGKSASVVPQTAASLGPPPTLSQVQVQSRAPISSLDTWPPPPPPPKSSTSGKLEPLPPPNKSKKRKRDVIDGAVVEEWAPRSGTSSTPWCVLDHSRTEDMGLWLHKEVTDFYDYAKPHEIEENVRLGLIDRIGKILEPTFPNATVRSFGSFASGLYLPTADMDLVLVSRQFIGSGIPQLGQSKKQLYRISSLLERGGVTQPGSTEVIAGARVPIIKLVDRVTGLKVDMSFENNTGIVANETFKEWKAQFPAMPVIATLVKHFLAMRNFNEVFSGGLGGFSVICMVVHYLQHLPAAQSGNQSPERHLGDIFMGFLLYYGFQFNIYNTRISLNPPQLQRKGYTGVDGRPTKPDRLSIIDPNKPTNDISSGSHNVEKVLASFRSAYESLHNRMVQLSKGDRSMRKDASILQSVFAGNYSSFEWQRDRLRKVYDHQ